MEIIRMNGKFELQIKTLDSAACFMLKLSCHFRMNSVYRKKKNCKKEKSAVFDRQVKLKSRSRISLFH